MACSPESPLEQKSPLKDRLPFALLLPVELTDEIFLYLDRADLAALCAVSWRTMEQVVPRLYRHIALTTDAQLLHFFASPGLPHHSRLRAVLNTSHMRSLSLNVVRTKYIPPAPDEPLKETLSTHIAQHGTYWLPARFASFNTVPLDTLTLTLPPPDYAETYWLAFLPHLNPRVVHFWSEETEQLSRTGFEQVQGITRCDFLLGWTRLWEVSFVGWVPRSLGPLRPYLHDRPRPRHPRPAEFFLDEWTHRGHAHRVDPDDVGSMVQGGAPVSVVIQERLLRDAVDDDLGWDWRPRRGTDLLGTVGMKRARITVEVTSEEEDRETSRRESDLVGAGIAAEDGPQVQSAQEGGDDDEEWRAVTASELRDRWLNEGVPQKQVDKIEIVFR